MGVLTGIAQTHDPAILGQFAIAVYTHTHTHMRARARTHTQTHTNTHTHICIHKQNTNKQTHAHIGVGVLTGIAPTHDPAILGQFAIAVYTHTHTHMRARARTHTQTHTNTHTHICIHKQNTNKQTHAHIGVGVLTGIAPTHDPAILGQFGIAVRNRPRLHALARPEVQRASSEVEHADVIREGQPRAPLEVGMLHAFVWFFLYSVIITYD